MKHRMSNSRIYHIYNGIKQRCYNPNNPNYYLYGGRGISLCEEWNEENGFENFYGWAVQNGYNDFMTIDRIDPNEGYSPDNCQWVSRSENSQNVTMRGGREETAQALQEYKAMHGGRPSKTSTKVKQKYLNKVYTQVAVRLPKDLVAQWEEKLKAENLGKAEFFRNAMQEYLKIEKRPGS